jgi:hypothetical protein
MRAFMEPYTYVIVGMPVLMTTISFPVYSNGSFIGVGGLDMALDDVSAKLARSARSARVMRCCSRRAAPGSRIPIPRCT